MYICSKPSLIFLEVRSEEVKQDVYLSRNLVMSMIVIVTSLYHDFSAEYIDNKNSLTILTKNVFKSLLATALFTLKQNENQ